MAVYGLKRATPKMKYHHMNYVLEWRADLREKQAEEFKKREELSLEFGDAKRVLALNDPMWETWYDDDRNVPQEIGWNENDLNPILYRMRTRTMHVQMRDEMPHLLSRGN